MGHLTVLLTVYVSIANRASLLRHVTRAGREKKLFFVIGQLNLHYTVGSLSVTFGENVKNVKTSLPFIFKNVKAVLHCLEL